MTEQEFTDLTERATKLHKAIHRNINELYKLVQDGYNNGDLKIREEHMQSLLGHLGSLQVTAWLWFDR